MKIIKTRYSIEPRDWVEVNDESRGTDTSSDTGLILRSNLGYYADAYIFVMRAITITGDAGPKPNPNALRTEAQLLAARQADGRNKGVKFKNCALFTSCISRISNKDIDNAQDFDIVMPMYNLVEYSDNYSKISESLWQYYKDDPNDNITQSESFKFKINITARKWEYKRC